MTEVEGTPTLGQFADELERWKAKGFTLGSVEYVVDRVYWEEMDERQRNDETLGSLADSNLTQHAKRELALVREERPIVDSTLAIVREFSKVGHSGSSAHFHREMLSLLLDFKNLAPLTSHPDEWVLVGDLLWQNVRNSEAFSEDAGVT